MMTSLFHLMYSAYRRSGESDSDAYYRSILFLAIIRLTLYSPLVYFSASLLNCKPNKLSVILYLIIGIIYSYFRAPQKQSCKSNKKFDRMPKSLVFTIACIIVFLLGIGAPIVCILVGKYIIDPYGLEGWLLRFFH